MKAAVASPVVADGCAIPVFCGLATGADAPNECKRSEVMSAANCCTADAAHPLPPFLNEGNRRRKADPVSLARFCRQGYPYSRCAASSTDRRHLATAPNRSAGLLAGPNAERGRLCARNIALRLIRGIAVNRIQLGERVGCGQGQIICVSAR